VLAVLEVALLVRRERDAERGGHVPAEAGAGVQGEEAKTVERHGVAAPIMPPVREKGYAPTPATSGGYAAMGAKGALNSVSTSVHAAR
jgi:hypothetical protein